MIALIHTACLSADELLAVFCGKSLLAWSIIQAQSCSAVDRVVVPSVDGRVDTLAQRLGATVIDSIAETDAVKAGVGFSESNADARCLLILPAHAPLRTAEDLHRACELLPAEGAGYVVSVAKPSNWNWSAAQRRMGTSDHIADAGIFYVLRDVTLSPDGWTGHGRTIAVDAWQTQSVNGSRGCRAVARLFDEFVRPTLPAAALGASDLDLVVYDFDGVMTDNRVYVNQEAVETVAANRSDGLGVAWLKAAGIPQMILSTEKNPVVAARAQKLGLPVLQGIGDKAAALKQHCDEQGFQLGRVLFVGNDLNDEGVMRLVGHPVCPADAYPPIREIAEIVLQTKGGFGVLRELAELLVGPREEK